MLEIYYQSKELAEKFEKKNYKLKIFIRKVGGEIFFEADAVL